MPIRQHLWLGLGLAAVLSGRTDHPSGPTPGVVHCIQVPCPRTLNSSTLHARG